MAWIDDICIRIFKSGLYYLIISFVSRTHSINSQTPRNSIEKLEFGPAFLLNDRKTGQNTP